MNLGKARAVFLFCSLAVLLPFLAGALARSTGEEEDSLYKNLSVLSEVLTLIQRVHVDENSVEQLLEGALHGTTDALGPTATFVPAAEAEVYAATSAVGDSHSGLRLAKEGGIAFVLSVLDGSPGDVADVRVGDVLASVNDQSTRLVPLWRLEHLLAGEAGEPVELALLREGQTLERTVELGPFELPKPALDWVKGQPVVTLSYFGSTTVEEVSAILATLQDVPSLVLDLRGAGSGDGDTAFAVAALFVQGELGQLTRKASPVASFDSEDAPAWQGEVIALVDRGTAGPGEILATVLRQGSVARLVGEPTFGHAGRESVVRLSGGGQLRLTEAFFAGADGVPIDDQLEPDVIVRRGIRRLDEESEPVDAALEKALELLAAAVDEREVA